MDQRIDVLPCEFLEKAQGLGFMQPFRVWGLGFRALGLGFGVWGPMGASNFWCYGGCRRLTNLGDGGALNPKP